MMDSDGFSAWAKGKKLQTCEEEKIKSFVDNLWEESRKFSTSPTFIVRKTLDFPTLSEGNNAKLEHLWERLLTASHKNIYNQFSLRNTNNIDMIKVGRNNTLTTLYELKTGTTNHLFYAAYEIVFYYFVLLKAYGCNTPITDEKGSLYRLKKSGMELTVVAPSAWFKATAKHTQPDEKTALQFLSCLEKQIKQLTGRPVVLKMLPLPTQKEEQMKKIVAQYERLKRTLKEIRL